MSSSQTFEILCPVCRSVVPPEAPRCLNCDGQKRRADDVDTAATAEAAPRPHTPPDLKTLPMRDYHRVVRATYQATERTAGSGNRVRAYLPFVVLVLLLIVGAGLLYGHI
jgi:hypothetical protein